MATRWCVTMSPAHRQAAPPAPRPLEGLTGSLDGPLFAVAPNGEIVSWDSQATELLGYTADEVMGRSFFDLIVDDDGHEPTRQTIAEALAGGEAWGSLRLRRSDGETVEVRTQQVALRGTSRHPAVVVVRARDPDLDHQLDTLFGSDQRQRALLEAADQLDLGLVVTVDDPDEGPVFAYVNDAAAELLDREIVDLVGTSIQAVLPPGASQQLNALRDRALEGELGTHVVETEIARPDGTLVPVEAGWGRGELDGAPATFAFFRDIRDRRIDAEEIEALQRRASRVGRLAATRGVIGAVAQELRASITEAAATLHAYRTEIGDRAEGAVEGGRARQAADDLCRSVLDSLWRAEALVQRMGKSLSDVAEEIPTEATGSSPLHVCVGESLDAFEAAHPSVVVERHLAQTPAVGLRDIEVEHIVRQVLTNAVDAAEDHARITVRTQESPEGPRLIVEDQGAGIPPEGLDQILEPFFTTKEGALGLGLAMVETLVGEAGGSVEIDSRHGDGTTVTVTLPPAERAVEADR